MGSDEDEWEALYKRTAAGAFEQLQADLEVLLREVDQALFKDRDGTLMVLCLVLIAAVGCGAAELAPII
jgi:hypothetical protein